MKKILIYICIGILGLVLGLGLYVLYDYLKHKNDCCSCCEPPVGCEDIDCPMYEPCIDACCRCK